MRTTSLALGLLGCLALSAPAGAQAPAVPREGQVSVDPERLAAARRVVAASQGDRTALLQAMSAPMIGMVRQMGVNDPEKAQIMVRDVIMPVLTAHYDELLSIQALSYAAVLSKEDLQAIAAFYGTPAGQNLVKGQPQLTQASLTGMRQWLGMLTGELQAKLADAAKAQAGKPKSN